LYVFCSFWRFLFYFCLPVLCTLRFCSLLLMQAFVDQFSIPSGYDTFSSILRN
jgi:hypothetical protein